MPKKPNKKLTARQQDYRARIKEQVKQKEQERHAKLIALKKAGLYSGSLRKRTTTKYQRKVLAQGEQYLRGNAVKVLDQHNMSAKERKVLANSFPQLLTYMNGKLLAKNAYMGQKVKITKDKQIVSLSDYGNQKIEVRWILPNEKIPELDPKRAQSYVLPMWRGPNRPLHYIYATELEEILAIAHKYQGNETNPYENAVNYIQIRSILNFKPIYIKGQEKAFHDPMNQIDEISDSPNIINDNYDNFDDDFDDDDY